MNKGLIISIMVILITLPLIAAIEETPSFESTISSVTNKTFIGKTVTEMVVEKCGCNYDGVCDEDECTTCKDCLKIIKPVEEVNRITKTVQVACVVNEDLMKEVDKLVLELQHAEELGDYETAEQIKNEIQILKEKIEEENEKCNSAEAVGSESGVVRVVVDKCVEMKKTTEKIEYYQSLLELDDETLNEKGLTREEIEKIIDELKENLEDLKDVCKVSSGDEVEPVPMSNISTTLLEISKPVAPESGEEIVEYYQSKVSKIISDKKEGIEKKIEELKNLRDEIDEMITKLIEMLDQIRSEEIEPLVDKIEIKPNRIVAGSVSVETKNKTIVAKIGKRNLEIKPEESEVIIRDGEIQTKTKGVTIRNNTLIVDGVEVKINPADAVKKLGVEPEEVELEKEGDKLVYKVKKTEERRFLGLIPVNVVRETVVDATTSDIISENLPWWAFLTFGP